MPNLPVHRNEHTGDSTLDRIQSNVRDVIAYLRSLVWVPNRAYAALTADFTQAATAVYATLLTVTLTTTLVDSFLLVSFSASGQQITNASIDVFMITVDGVATKGCYQSTVLAGVFSVALIVRVPVHRGKHTIELQTKVNTSSLTIHASTVAEEHAHLYVEEVPA